MENIELASFESVMVQVAGQWTQALEAGGNTGGMVWWYGVGATMSQHGNFSQASDQRDFSVCAKLHARGASLFVSDGLWSNLSWRGALVLW